LGRLILVDSCLTGSPHPRRCPGYLPHTVTSKITIGTARWSAGASRTTIYYDRAAHCRLIGCVGRACDGVELLRGFFPAPLQAFDDLAAGRPSNCCRLPKADDSRHAGPALATSKRAATMPAGADQQHALHPGLIDPVSARASLAVVPSAAVVLVHQRWPFSAGATAPACRITTSHTIVGTVPHPAANRAARHF
jgi:hypothetical protein